MSKKHNSRLGDFFENRREKGRAGLPLLSVTMNEGLVDREDLERKQDTSLAPEDHLLVKPGDIAYNMMRMWQGAFGLAAYEGVVSPAYVVLRAKSGINPSYASYLFETPRLRHFFRAYSHGLTDDRLRLYFSDFCKIPVWIPAPEQQEAVVSKLSTWDRSIELTEALLRNAKQMKLAMVRRTMRQHGADGVVAWPRVPLGDIAHISSGGTPDRSEKRYWGGPIPWVTTSEVQFNTITSTPESITSEGLKSSSAKIFPPNTLLMAMYGQGRTRGQVAKLAVPAATNQACAAILLNDDQDPDFFLHFLSSQYQSIRALANGGAQKNLSASLIKEVMVPIVPLHEQRRIAEELRRWDESIRLTEQLLHRTRQQRAAVMRRLIADGPPQ